VIKPIPEITDLGRRYAEVPAAAPEKEALLLELCQCFHPYLMKYLVMICRGHVPVAGRGDRGAPVNKDIKPFLLYFLPKGQKLDWHNMNQIVKHFHLAFKGIDTPEIYDILIGRLVATIKGYDPAYTDKVKLLVEVIENELSTRKIRLLGTTKAGLEHKEVHRPSAASRNASKSLAAAFRQLE
jgi:hypothetical protein